MPSITPSSALSEKELLEKEKKYCSWGDTVHYLEPPKFFETCEGSYLYDREGVPFLDLQMWYSAASFGYRNERLGNALKKQIDKLPQLACQYLHSEKVELAEKIAKSMERLFGEEGRVHFKPEADGSVVADVHQRLGRLVSENGRLHAERLIQ